MKTKTIRVAIRWKDWVKMRKVFPGRYDESAADYMERLADYLKEKQSGEYDK